MDTIHYEAAGAGTTFGFLAILVGGLVITGALVWAVRFGTRVRGREHAHLRPGEHHPRVPEGGPVRETHELREPDEMPRAADGSERLTPHELRNSGGRRSEDQAPRRWDEGSSGSFGSGGTGGR
ncbi:DUF6479 family protein [Streptomyces sp. NPDC048751]|uniref:DUF6479 family protein n=1 Tax=Streptomyces sp. NPDC048751 TaxID=3365591 RepID=UPI00371C9678